MMTFDIYQINIDRNVTSTCSLKVKIRTPTGGTRTIYEERDNLAKAKEDFWEIYDMCLNEEQFVEITLETIKSNYRIYRLYNGHGRYEQIKPNSTFKLL